MSKPAVQKFVLFGATGDLSQRMVWPSLYHLCREKLVPPTLTFVGSARHGMPNEEFRQLRGAQSTDRQVRHPQFDDQPGVEGIV